MSCNNVVVIPKVNCVRAMVGVKMPVYVPSLDDYATKEFVYEKMEHKLDATKLDEAIYGALAQAKASGEFKGDKGEKGEKGLQGEKGADGRDGRDGKDGKDGGKGEDGRTPIKGEDYFTEEDKAEFVEEMTPSLKDKVEEIIGDVDLDSFTTIKIDVTKLIFDYLDGNISGDGELMKYSAIADYINISEEKFIYILKNVISNIVILEIKDNTVADDYQSLAYTSQITNIDCSGGIDLNDGLTNIAAAINLTNMFQYLEDVQNAMLVFRVVGIEPLKVRWYLEVYRNN